MKKLVVRKQTLQLISLKDKTKYIILVTNYISCSKEGCVWSYRFQHNASRKTLNIPPMSFVWVSEKFQKKHCNDLHGSIAGFDWYLVNLKLNPKLDTIPSNNMKYASDNS